ncbi:MAG: hypothetical protein JKY81_01675 [Colwellia sp.]|nr:hypothetical protein [Colwellia sp.]
MTIWTGAPITGSRICYVGLNKEEVTCELEILHCASPRNLVSFIANLNSHLKEIPIEFREAATISMKHTTGWEGFPDTTYYFQYVRPAIKGEHHE